MLSQNKKIIISTITSLVIAGATLGGATVNAQPSNINTSQNGFDNQQYQFPPADALQQRPPAANQVTRPAGNAQGQGYPRPYPNQQPMNQGRPPSYGPQGGFPPNAMRSGPGGPPPYGMSNPYNRNPYNQGQYGNPYNRGPYNTGSYGGNPYGRNNYGQNNNSPFNNMGMGPFNGDSAPWETWPFGARDSFWSRKEIPFKEQNPTDWFQPGDPKEGMAIMWDDLIAAPDDLGTMPGGWHVPSVSVPNPIDLEDQLEKASKEIPDLIRVYND